MDIDKIAYEILNDKPKPKFSFLLNLDVNTDINQQFEIISLIFLRIIEEKISKLSLNINDVKQLKQFILKQLVLVKLYLNSLGIDLKYSNLEKKECKQYKLNSSPIFYSNNKYNFEFCFLKKFNKNGKNLELLYNYNIKTKSLEELFLIIKLQNHYFKIELDLLKK